jgi:hypothetical protein
VADGTRVGAVARRWSRGGAVTKREDGRNFGGRDRDRTGDPLLAKHGFIARVEPGTRFEFEQEPVSPGVWLPSHFAVRSRSKVVCLFSHQTEEDDTYFDYYPAQTSTSSAAKDPSH